MSEQVNQSSHYNLEERKECIKKMADKYGIDHTILWCVMTAEKYMYRAGAKDGNPEDQDLKKAMWYIQWAREHLKDDACSSAWLEAQYYKAADKLLAIIQDYYDRRQKGE